VPHKDDLRNIITYFAYKVPNLSKTKLIKLIYLADLEFYKRFRSTITDISFINYHYGPWNPEIEEFVERECGSTISLEIVQKKSGEIIKINKPKLKETTYDSQRREFWISLTEVVKHWGSKPLPKDH